VQGQTFPAPAATRQAVELRAKSMATYGKPAEEIEAECLARLGYNTTPVHAAQAPQQDAAAEQNEKNPPVGRRKKIQPTDQPTDQPPDPPSA